MWSPELETLDQLIGGDLPLSVILGMFDDRERVIRGILAMLKTGEVRLLTHRKDEIPQWHWTEILTASSIAYEQDTRRLALRISRDG